MIRITNLCFIIIALATSSTNAQNALFSNFNQNLDIDQQNIYNNLLELETSKRARIVSINYEALRSSELILNFFNDNSAVVQKTQIGHTGIMFRSWTGVEAHTLGSASILINEERISGHFTSINGNFEIAPLGNNGAHMVFENDNEKFQACATEDNVIENENQNNKKINRLDKKNNHKIVPSPEHNMNSRSYNDEINESRSIGNECFIRLVIAYTPGAKTNTNITYGRTMNEHVALAVLDQNLAHANSLVEQRVELAYLYPATDLETSSSTTDVNDLQANGDGKWDEIHTHRDTYDGDMCA
ncbi:MAG: hypothetical protein HKN22_04820, partial [Bacteroidia bacterium]|nr:hypothetical protein [Bacteroidia bacterium]